VSRASALGLLYLITFGSLIGFTSYIWLLDKVSPAKLGTYAYVNPIVAVLLGWAIAGEALSIRTVIAAAIVICAVALITSARSATTVHSG
jgi:drug/metabolite transporter (DMT)-like permease